MPNLSVTKNLDKVDVADFGPVADGVADDTAALQAALDATRPGGVTYIPAGRYLVTAVTANQRNRIEAAPGAILVQGSAAGAATPMITLTADGSSVDGLSVEGVDTPAAYDTVWATLPGNVGNYAAINADGTTDTRITDVAVTGKICGVSLVSANSAAVTGCRVSGFYPGPTQPVNFHTGIYIIGGADHRVHGLRASDIGSAVLTGNSTQRCHIGSSVSMNTGDNGFYYSSASDSVITDCRVITSAGSGIKARGSGNTITANIITDTSVGVSVTGVSTGVVGGTWGGAGVHVTGNRIARTSADGILVSQFEATGFYLRDAVVTGNTLEDCASGGTASSSIRAVVEYSTISNNTIRDDGSANTAILVAGGGSSPNPAGLVITGNVIDGSVADNIRAVNLADAVIAENTGNGSGNNRFIRLFGVTGSQIIGNLARQGRLEEDAASDLNMFAGNVTPIGDVLSGTNRRPWDNPL